MINIEGIIGLMMIMIMFMFVFSHPYPDESIKRYLYYLKRDTDSRLKNRKSLLQRLKETIGKWIYGK